MGDEAMTGQEILAAYNAQNNDRLGAKMLHVIIDEAMAAEREACADLIARRRNELTPCIRGHPMGSIEWVNDHALLIHLENLENAIRARGQEKPA
jgi:hypothetical protein